MKPKTLEEACTALTALWTICLGLSQRDKTRTARERR